MDVNVTRMQESIEKNQKEKQCTEGRCFACNKQGHIKRNCPLSVKGGNLPENIKSVPIAQVVQVGREGSEEVTHETSQSMPLETKCYCLSMWINCCTTQTAAGAI